jgi:hypothetical protein
LTKKKAKKEFKIRNNPRNTVATNI